MLKPTSQSTEGTQGARGDNKRYTLKVLDLVHTGLGTTELQLTKSGKGWIGTTGEAEVEKSVFQGAK